MNLTSNTIWTIPIWYMRCIILIFDIIQYFRSGKFRSITIIDHAETVVVSKCITNVKYADFLRNKLGFKIIA